MISKGIAPILIVLALAAGGMAAGSFWYREANHASTLTHTSANPPTASGTFPIAPASPVTTSSPSVSGPGGPCGGNTAHPLGCVPDYHCAPRAGSDLPFGDVGGVCVANATTSFITEAQAIAIVVRSADLNTSTYGTNASFKNGDWYVDFYPLPPTSTPQVLITGGNGAYVIDGTTGAILSKAFGQ